MIRFIAYHTGYVENCTVAVMVYQCGFFGHLGYASVKEAWLEFTKDIYAKYFDDVLSVRIPTNDCCKTASMLGSGHNSAEMREKYRVCEKCNTELKERPFDAEEFMDYFSNLRKDTCDSYGDAEDTSSRNLCWWPFWTKDFIGASKEQILYLGEYAELTLLNALYELHPELITEKEKYRGHSSDWELIKQNIKPNI